MKKFGVIITFLMFFLMSPLFTDTIIAQPPPPDAEDIPIDGGLSILVAAGIAYGARRIYKQQKEADTE